MAISESLVVGRRRDWLANWAGLAVAGVLFLASIIAAAYLGPDEAKRYFGEDGPVEIGTPITLVLAALLYLAWKARVGARSLVPPFMLMLMAGRELDADKWFTEKSLLSTGYYFDNPGVPYSQRIVFGIIVAAIGLVILHFLWRSRAAIVSALRDFQPYCRSLIVAFSLGGLSQVLDGLGRDYLWLMGVRQPHIMNVIGGISEETAELAMPLLFVVALLQLRFDPRRNTLPESVRP